MSNLFRLPAFVQGETVHVVVESPRGSSVKLKYDVSLGAMSISRPLLLGLSYPYDWGFVPSTRGQDGDPLDAVLLWDVATFPGVVVPCQAVALLKVDKRGPGGRVRNDHLIMRPSAARRESELPPAAAISPRVRAEVAAFLLASTALEQKDARILGWDGADAVLELIRSSLAGEEP